MVSPRSPHPAGSPSALPGYSSLIAIRARSDGTDVEDRCGDLLDWLCTSLDVPGAVAYANEPLGLVRLADSGLSAPERITHPPDGYEAGSRIPTPPGPAFDDSAVYAHPILCADGPGGLLLIARPRATVEPTPEQQMMATATACRLGVMVERRRRRIAEEWQRKEAQRLHEAQKLQAMGSMVRGVAHDLNNLLTVVLGQLQLAGEAAPEHEEVQTATGRALDAVGMASGITEQLLKIARDRASEPKSTHWNLVIRRMDRLLATMIGRRGALELDLDETIGPVRADPALLAQIVLNLVLNARDALPAEGTVGITTFERQTDGGGETSVILRVSDDGVGMDETVRARIFEPLFTTKPRGEGTGLGLPTVVRIVENCGGRVRVDSAPGHGTTFEIELPRAQPS